MAGTLIVSNLTTDTDNTFIVRSNTGTTLFSANTTGIDVANSIGATAITNDKILSVANTKISGNIISSQITSVANTQLTGLIQAAQIGSANATLVTSGTLPGARLPAGSILQVVQATKTDTFSAADTGSYVDITGLSLNITPSSASSKILIMVSMGICTSYGSGRERTSAFRIFRNSTSVLDGTPAGSRIGSLFRRGDDNVDNNHSSGASYQVVDSPNTTSSVTYKVSVEVEGGATFYLNRSPNDENDGDSYGSRTASTIIAMEIAG